MGQLHRLIILLKRILDAKQSVGNKATDRYYGMVVGDPLPEPLIHTYYGRVLKQHLRSD